MSDTMHLWLRHETRAHEQRAAITPDGVAALLAAGLQVSVESSPVRVFQDQEYAAAGAALVPTGGWIDAPADAVIVGLKELPAGPAELVHRHVFFGHAYKGQPGAEELIARFAAGGGTLLDLEYLVGEDGRRVAAFGFWAGYIGAALAVLQDRGVLEVPLRPTDRGHLDGALRRSRDGRGDGRAERAVVIGSAGRSGSGAVAALQVAGVEVTGWERAETRRLDRPALLSHDLMVHCVLATEPAPALLRTEDITWPQQPERALRMLSDVTCDLGSELNLVPVNQQATSWDEPIRVVPAGDGNGPDLQVIAIDNLPSLLPREASAAFSADLVPQLLTLAQGASPVWDRAAALYREHRQALSVGGVR